MKLFFILLFLFLYTNAKSQTVNIIHYKSDVMTEVLTQNYFQDSEKVIYNRALGTNIDIIVDTVFKKYTITFTDKDNDRKVMVYTYIKDYFLDKKNNKSGNKLYLMEFSGVYFMLGDYSNLFGVIDIFHDRKYYNNCTMEYRIAGITKIP